MGRRPLLTVMLTTVAALGGTVAIAGCGGKSESSTSKTPTTSTENGAHKHPSKAPAY
ncbi:MAG: hypothetical protein FWD42_04115 [Solirubrobacterales bacterium]|nr:hypothetical protein [Solirubrobacterales bacterium]